MRARAHKDNARARRDAPIAPTYRIVRDLDKALRTAVRAGCVVKVERNANGHTLLTTNFPALGNLAWTQEIEPPAER